MIVAQRLGDDSPILSIHDVGAGGLSNALPELVNDSDLGARFELRSIPNAEPGMSPLEIWCNEAQERYVLALDAARFEVFVGIAERERCPYALVGNTTAEARIVLTDRLFDTVPIDLPLSVLFGKPPRMTRLADRTSRPLRAFESGNQHLRRRRTSAAHAGRRGQDILDYHWRPKRYRTDSP